MLEFQFELDDLFERTRAQRLGWKKGQREQAGARTTWTIPGHTFRFSFNAVAPTCVLLFSIFLPFSKSLWITVLHALSTSRLYSVKASANVPNSTKVFTVKTERRSGVFPLASLRIWRIASMLIFRVNVNNTKTNVLYQINRLSSVHRISISTHTFRFLFLPPFVYFCRWVLQNLWPFSFLNWYAIINLQIIIPFKIIAGN